LFSGVAAAGIEAIFAGNFWVDFINQDQRKKLSVKVVCSPQIVSMCCERRVFIFLVDILY
jgi:hypothetical protein